MKTLLILTALCGAVFSAQFMDIRKSGDVCYWRGEKMAIGDIKTPPHDCVRVMCNREGNGTLATIHTCGAVFGEKGWKVVKTKNVPYPECCPKAMPVDKPESKNMLNNKL